MHVYYEFQMYRVVMLCIIFAKKSDVNTADAATMKTRAMHVWSQMVLVWVKQVLPATSLLGLRPTSGLWSTVGIDVSVHFRLFVNTDLVMLLLLNSVDTNRVRSIWLLQSTALHIHQTTTTVTKKPS